MPKDKELVRIIDSYNDRVDDNRRAYLNSFGVIGSADPNVPRAEDLILKYMSDPVSLAGQSILCTATVGSQYGAPAYNRTKDIDLYKCEKNVEQQQGFSYKAAGVGSAWVRPNLDKCINTQSGHRTTKLYAVTLDPNARINIQLHFHDPKDSEEEQIRKESDDHFTDAADRKSQSGTDKFKSAYYAGRPWAKDLHDYCLPFSIGIAGTLENAKFNLPSHNYLSTARKKAGDGNVTRYLKAFTGNECETLIQASCVLAGALFLKQFSPQIARIDELNGVDSFNLMIKWWFKEYGPVYKSLDPDKRCCTQLDIIDGGAFYKGTEPSIARFVYLYNDFVRLQIATKGWKKNENSKTAIPFQGSEKKEKDTGWNDFLVKANHLIKPMLQELATKSFF